MQGSMCGQSQHLEGYFVHLILYTCCNGRGSSSGTTVIVCTADKHPARSRLPCMTQCNLRTCTSLNVRKVWSRVRTSERETLL